MPTRVINDSNNNDGELRTVRIDTTDLPLQGADITPIDLTPPSADDKTELVRPPSGRGGMRDDGDATVLVRRPKKDGGAPVEDPVEELSPETWCVGWLVAISGPHCGASFPLRLGMNHIGRGETNNVCIPMDAGISRKPQVVVTYDKRRNQFFIAPGAECSQTSELNDSLLLAAAPLESGAVIRLSDDTQVRFVAFCDSQFHWDY